MLDRRWRKGVEQGLGPIGDRLHSAEEFVRLPSLAERARLAARFLEKFAAGEIGIPAK